MNRTFSLGGVIASVILIAVGVGAIAIGAVGYSDVGDTLAREKIVGSPDMNPDDTAVAVREAGLENVEIPDCTVSEEAVDNGSEAKCFADYMRIHTLEDTGGKTYAEMPRFATEDGAGTNDPEEAQTDESGAPMSNPERNIWVTETALATALNTSYFAQQVGMFAVVMGIALLLTGIGFLVLTLGGLRRERSAAS